METVKIALQRNQGEEGARGWSGWHLSSAECEHRDEDLAALLDAGVYLLQEVTLTAPDEYNPNQRRGTPCQLGGGQTVPPKPTPEWAGNGSTFLSRGLWWRRWIR